MLADLGRSLARDVLRFLIAFAFGTLAAGVACLYFGLPLILSFLGGIAVLGLALALNA